MAGRPKIFNREEVLDKSIQLFWEKGYEQTSTVELLKAVQLNKGSLYNEFNSKEELFIEGLKQLETKALNAFEDKLKTSDQPLNEIKLLFKSIIDSNNEDNCKGCILGNTIMEFAGQNPQIVKEASFYIVKLELLFEEYIEKAKNNEQFSSEHSSKDIAQYLINFWNGINVSRRVYQEASVLENMINFHLTILD
ncbi:TetR/AcrR family transcriptional regulator [Flammeovirga pacifica]|uniref:HTH tetR-type domain-containing protein n=1 Tax=Flammeovirga pacifica TaxID=915059 RepID=A0A1S1YV26_FLAPC|nr:TetR/AcrR family transcriptional regulator [Flammeovirga pacifica]OHX64860.1 hypothetical protein NH26_00135 [Flammeovirga pacifica]